MNYMILNNSQPTKIFVGDGTDFSAIHDAQKWLKDHGYSFGSMCRSEPIGVKLGDFSIAKWRNLDDEDKDELDGLLTSNNFRNGTVHLFLFQK